jgi:hypothetical protein
MFESSQRWIWNAHFFRWEQQETVFIVRCDDCGNEIRDSFSECLSPSLEMKCHDCKTKENKKLQQEEERPIILSCYECGRKKSSGWRLKAGHLLCSHCSSKEKNLVKPFCSICKSNRSKVALPVKQGDSYICDECEDTDYIYSEQEEEEDEEEVAELLCNYKTSRGIQYSCLKNNKTS